MYPPVHVEEDACCQGGCCYYSLWVDLRDSPQQLREARHVPTEPAVGTVSVVNHCPGAKALVLATEDNLVLNVNGKLS